MNIIDWRLCLVADVEAAGERDLRAIVAEALEGGITLLQLRAKKLDTRPFLDLAADLLPLVRSDSIPLIINDRVDIALASGAYGVHLGQNDMSPAEARKLLGKDAIIGISANTVEEARAAEAGGADYIGLSPVFSTPSKTDPDPPIGLSGIRRLTEAVTIPGIAIGGIKQNNAADVFAAGAAGIAVISAIMGAEDIRESAAELRRIVDAIRSNPSG
ncbi:MAG: thiamine phosphate synthase [Candidatus Aminicenantes bacterium]|nr:thiamine phosphate synthase [Candidatus Aminicenantes bacterium]